MVRTTKRADCSSTDQGGGKRRSGIWLQTKAAPKQQSRRRRLSANGFAFIPNAVLPGRQWGVEPAVGESPHLLSPSCVTGDEGSDPTTKAYDPRSRPQAAFLRPLEPTDNRSEDQRPGANGIGATSGKHRADTEPLKL